jgi:hypothetical protein
MSGENIQRSPEYSDLAARKLARPEGFEPPTPWFVARYSIQLSYGRAVWCCGAADG